MPAQPGVKQAGIQLLRQFPGCRFSDFAEGGLPQR